MLNFDKDVEEFREFIRDNPNFLKERDLIYDLTDHTTVELNPPTGKKYPIFEESKSISLDFLFDVQNLKELAYSAFDKEKEKIREVANGKLFEILDIYAEYAVNQQMAKNIAISFVGFLFFNAFLFGHEFDDQVRMQIMNDAEAVVRKYRKEKGLG